MKSKISIEDATKIATKSCEALLKSLGFEGSVSVVLTEKKPKPKKTIKDIGEFLNFHNFKNTSNTAKLSRYKHLPIKGFIYIENVIVEHSDSWVITLKFGKYKKGSKRSVSAAFPKDYLLSDFAKWYNQHNNEKEYTPPKPKNYSERNAKK